MIKQPNEYEDTELLTGIDGSNPLAFLAAIGAMCVLNTQHAVTMRWMLHANTWTPQICLNTQEELTPCGAICACLDSDLAEPWSINKRLPFAASEFRARMLQELKRGMGHELDFYAAFGSDAFIDETGNFQDTAFRMVRSGDAAGSGMPDYAMKNAARCNDADIHAALYGPWTYGSKLSLRWDPSENREYAYLASNPSGDSPMSAIGANRLAIEGLALYPTMPAARGLETVGFLKGTRGKDPEFRWPIWEVPLTVDEIRSLLTCPLLFTAENVTVDLREIGVVAVFCARQIKPNQYYRNFAPSYQL